VIDHDIDCWTPERVEAALIKAARWIVATAGPVGPRGFRSSMPTPIYDWGDFLAQVSEGGVGIAAARDERPARPRLSSREVTEMERALEWPLIYLRAEPGLRRSLAMFVGCRANRQPFSEFCRRRGLSRRSL
jgi:hypothetical protein